MSGGRKRDGEEERGVSRRSFFRLFGGAATNLIREEKPERHAPPPQALPQRVLGRTGVPVPILGFGTASLGRGVEDDVAVALLNEAIDLGVTYFDTASTEGGYGRAQQQIGQVMKWRRRQVFLATKVFEPDADAGRRMLERNLRYLQTDQVDLLYAHSLGHDRMDPDVVFGPGGVMRLLLDAQREGLTRFIGVTGHCRPERILRAIRDYDLDVVMTAVNFVDAHTYRFEATVWPEARRRGLGLVAMKVYGGTEKERHTPAVLPREWHDLAFRYALSLPGCATAVIGMVDRRELHENVQRARAFQPLSVEEKATLAEEGARLATEWGEHLGPIAE